MDDQIYQDYIKAGKIAGAAREYGANLIKENVSLLKVAEEVESLILKKGGKLAFPVNLAINDIAAHFTPRPNDKLVFRRGDVVKIDVGVHINGYIGDTAKTVEVGTLNWTELIIASKEALAVAIEIIKPGVKLNVIGGAIEQTINSLGFKSITNLTGHSMKQYNLHAGLSIPNVKGGFKGKIEEGDVIAIEPFATNGAGKVEGKKSGNIYRLLRKGSEREIKNQHLNALVKHIEKEYSTLPFCERWCYDFDRKAHSYLHRLLRYGIITSYSTLREKGGGTVTQTEHTVIVTRDGCEVTTL